MSKTQVLMTVSDFSIFFFGIISWKRALFFNGVFFFLLWGASFLNEGAPYEGALVLLVGLPKKKKKKEKNWAETLHCDI